MNVKYYNINFQLKKIDLIQDYEPPAKTSQGNRASNLYNGFDCILMYSNSYHDVIACFYYDNYPGDIGIFSLSLYSSNNEIINDLGKVKKVDMSPKFLKAVASPDKGKALVVFSDDSGIGYYLKYDININDFTSEIVKYMAIGGDFPSSVQVQYFRRTHEYIFSMSNKKVFKMAKFDNEMNIIINNDLNAQIDKDLILDGDTYGIYFII